MISFVVDDLGYKRLDRMDSDDSYLIEDEYGFILLDAITPGTRAGMTRCTQGKTVPCGNVCRQPQNCKKSRTEQPPKLSAKTKTKAANKTRSATKPQLKEEYQESGLFDVLLQKPTPIGDESKREARIRLEEQRRQAIRQAKNSSNPADDSIPDDWKTFKASNNDRQSFVNNLISSSPIREMWALNRLHDSKKEASNPPYPEEVLALKLYTTNDFSAMNGALRGMKDKDYSDSINPNMAEGRDIQSIRSEAIRDSKIVASALNALPDYKGTVYRGARSNAQWTMDDINAQYKPGAVITERGFTSTAKDTDSSFGSQGGVDVQFVINSKTGKSIEEFSESTQEKEVLFRPSTQFKVLRREDRDGKTIIYMDEV